MQGWGSNAVHGPYPCDREQLVAPAGGRSPAKCVCTAAHLALTLPVCLQVVAGLVSSEQVAGLLAQFQMLDTDGDGKLTVQELRTALAKQQKSGLGRLQDIDVRAIMERCVHVWGCVHVAMTLAATLLRRQACRVCRDVSRMP
jgi:hypothetical protein